MLIEELAAAVAIDPYAAPPFNTTNPPQGRELHIAGQGSLWIQANHLTAPPQRRLPPRGDNLSQSTRVPQPVCERGIVDLEAVVDPNGVASLGLARRGG